MTPAQAQRTTIQRLVRLQVSWAKRLPRFRPGPARTWGQAQLDLITKELNRRGYQARHN